MKVTVGGQRLGVGGSALSAEYAAPAPGSATVVVDHTAVINTESARVGVNADYWIDAQSRRSPGARQQWMAYAELGAQFVRWPGGHKADGVTWFLDENGGTVTTPTPRLCRFGSGEWPATDATYWTPTNTRVGGSFSRDIYGLQSFLDDCVTARAEPVIVVALDTIFNTPTGTGAWTITKAQAIANAVEMVRWCNITNDYGVRYWELGNESWSDSTGYTAGYVTGGVPQPATYGADFADMAAAMKAVDPTILVGMNGNQQAFYETAIAAAGAANVDFLAAHRYPFFNTDYAAYLAISSPNMVSEANRASLAIAGLSAPHNSRIFVMMTETGFNSQPNDLGAAVIMAHILGAQLATGNIAATLVWNTRYPPGGASHDVLDDYNRLKPSGMGQSLAARLAPGKMVTATSSNADVVAYASRHLGLGRTAVLLINRALTSNAVNVAVAGATGGSRYQLSGTGSADQSPTLARTAVTVTAGLTPTLTLPGVSVTLLILH